MSDFSDRLKAALEKSGKSQRQVAEEIGATDASVSRYVKGEREPRISTVLKIAEALGVSVEWLQTGVVPYNTHIEMIIDYTTDGTDYQYCDNKGVLIRCGECKHLFVGDPLLWCNRKLSAFCVTKDDYCSFAVRRCQT